MMETANMRRMEADMIFLNMLLTATTGTDVTGAEIDPMTNTLMMGGFILILVVAMYFFTIRPQRKRDKELKEQVSKMAVGDQVVTIGGVTGTIANIKEDEVTISTSVAYTMITFKKSAINTVIPREK